MESRPLVIAGSGRSGTTWVLDVIAEANNLRTVFEPLNPDGVNEAISFSNYYAPKNAYEPELKRFMGKVFNGELKYLWPNTRSLPVKLRPNILQMTSWDYNYNLLSRYKKLIIQYLNYNRKKSYRPITKFIALHLSSIEVTKLFISELSFSSFLSSLNNISSSLCCLKLVILII